MLNDQPRDCFCFGSGSQPGFQVAADPVFCTPLNDASGAPTPIPTGFGVDLSKSNNFNLSLRTIQCNDRAAFSVAQKPLTDTLISGEPSF